MPKKCTPTREAIINRIRASERYARIRESYLPCYDVSIFGLNPDTMTKHGKLSMEDIIEELSK